MKEIYVYWRQWKHLKGLIDNHTLVLTKHHGLSGDELEQRMLDDLGDNHSTNDWKLKIIHPIAIALCDVGGFLSFEVIDSDVEHRVTIALKGFSGESGASICLEVNLHPKGFDSVFGLLIDGEIEEIFDDTTAFDLIDYLIWDSAN